jgi:hypothetical protein
MRWRVSAGRSTHGAWPASLSTIRFALGRAASSESLAVQGRGSSFPKIIVTRQVIRAAASRRSSVSRSFHSSRLAAMLTAAPGGRVSQSARACPAPSEVSAKSVRHRSRRHSRPSAGVRSPQPGQVPLASRPRDPRTGANPQDAASATTQGTRGARFPEPRGSKAKLELRIGIPGRHRLPHGSRSVSYAHAARKLQWQKTPVEQR